MLKLVISTVLLLGANTGLSFEDELAPPDPILNPQQAEFKCSGLDGSGKEYLVDIYASNLSVTEKGADPETLIRLIMIDSYSEGDNFYVATLLRNGGVWLEVPDGQDVYVGKLRGAKYNLSLACEAENPKAFSLECSFQEGSLDVVLVGKDLTGQEVYEVRVSWNQLMKPKQVFVGSALKDLDSFYFDFETSEYSGYIDLKNDLLGQRWRGVFFQQFSEEGTSDSYKLSCK